MDTVSSKHGLIYHSLQFYICTPRAVKFLFSCRKFSVWRTVQNKAESILLLQDGRNFFVLVQYILWKKLTAVKPFILKFLCWIWKVLSILWVQLWAKRTPNFCGLHCFFYLYIKNRETEWKLLRLKLNYWFKKWDVGSGVYSNSISWL